MKTIPVNYREIKGFSGYFASQDGQVVKEKKDKLLFLKERNIRNYKAYTLTDNSGKKRTVYTHQIVAGCFLHKPRGGRSVVVKHIDGDTSNNNISNLEWVTFSNFMKEQFETGVRSNKDLWKKRIAKYGPKGGLRSPGRKNNVTPEQVQIMYKLRKTRGFTLKMLSEKFDCSASHIHNLLKEYEK